jgi:phage tail-like protein
VSTSEKTLTRETSRSGRRIIPKLRSPHPISSYLPGLYQEDGFALRFTAALDRVLAPLYCTLDNLDAYFDPDLAPEDFLEWLSGWVGVAMDDTWPLDRRRAFVRRAGDLYRQRGTLQGLRELLALHASSQIEVSDSGGSTWSAVPGGQLPGSSDQRLNVRIRAADPLSSEVVRLRQLINDAKPANVFVALEIRDGPNGDQAPPLA